MNNVWQIIKIWIWVPISLLPGACHYVWTGPLLWNHSSSSAFDAWVGLWIFNVALVSWGIVIGIDETRKITPKQETTDTK